VPRRADRAPHTHHPKHHLKGFGRGTACRAPTGIFPEKGKKYPESNDTPKLYKILDDSQLPRYNKGKRNLFKEEYMKKLAVDKKAECMVCLSCENACAQAFYKNEDFTAQQLSCIKVKAGKDGGPKVVACVQCGKCAEACPKGAIAKNAKGVFVIDKKLCEGDGACVKACPFGLLVMPKGAKYPSKCIACGICAKNCPMNVLYVKQDEAKVA
jgi:Fe-S-cluster-containing hydrogenase component 2